MALCLFQAGFQALGTLNILLPPCDSPSGLDAIRNRRYESSERYSICNLSYIIAISTLIIMLIVSSTNKIHMEQHRVNIVVSF